MLLFSSNMMTLQILISILIIQDIITQKSFGQYRKNQNKIK